MQDRRHLLHWPKLRWLMVLMPVLAGCESSGVMVPEADLARIDQCVLVQESQAERLAAQHEQLDALIARLEDLGQLRGRIDALTQDIADLSRARRADCPEPAALAAADADPAPSTRGKKVIGEIETVRFEDIDLDLRARIDTGANTSSLDARDIQPFERDGERWVRFTIPVTDDRESIVVERPRSRRVRILQSAADEAESRPVVELRVSIGSTTHRAEFTLADRSSLSLPALIGRNILRDLMVVDVSLVDAARLPPRKQLSADRDGARDRDLDAQDDAGANDDASGAAGERSRDGGAEGR